MLESFMQGCADFGKAIGLMFYTTFTEYWRIWLLAAGLGAVYLILRHFSDKKLKKRKLQMEAEDARRMEQDG